MAPVVIRAGARTPLRYVPEVSQSLAPSRSMPATMKYNVRRDARMANIAHRSKSYAVRRSLIRLVVISFNMRRSVAEHHTE
jgi:hypothetical protein